MTSHSTNRRSPYAKYTCTACRIKKSRCQLSSSFQSPSNSPLPPNEACERCQRLGLSCVVQQNQRRGSAHSSTSRRNTIIEPENDTISINERGEREYPWYRNLQNTNSHSSAVVMAYRRRPGAFLGELLARMPAAPSQHKSIEVDPLSYFDPQRLPQYEKNLSKFRLWFPHLPTIESLTSLHDTSYTSSSMSPTSSYLLTVLLWLATSDTDRSSSLLHSIHVKTATVMVDLPKTIEAIIALELVAVFLPLGPSSSKTSSDNRYSIAPGENQLSAAIGIAQSMHLNTDCDSFTATMTSEPKSTYIEKYRHRALIWTSLMVQAAFNSLDEPHVGHFKIHLDERLGHHWRKYAQSSVTALPGLFCLSYRIDLLFFMHRWLNRIASLRLRGSLLHFAQHEKHIITDLMTRRREMDASMEVVMHGAEDELLWCRLEWSAAISNLIVYCWLGETDDYSTLLQSCRENTECITFSLGMIRHRTSLLEEALSLSEAALSRFSGLIPPISMISLIVSGFVNIWDALSRACSCLEFAVERKPVIRVLLKCSLIHFSNVRHIEARQDIKIAKSILAATLSEADASLNERSKICWLHRDKMPALVDLQREVPPSLGCGAHTTSTEDTLDTLSSMPLDFFERFISQYGSSWESL